MNCPKCGAPGAYVGLNVVECAACTTPGPGPLVPGPLHPSWRPAVDALWPGHAGHALVQHPTIDLTTLLECAPCGQKCRLTLVSLVLHPLAPKGTP